MASPYYVNSDDEPVWMYTARTRAGAYQMARTLQKHLGVKILEEPMERDDELWVIMFTNPWMPHLASS